jgi:hypothetical protein
MPSRETACETAQGRLLRGTDVVLARVAYRVRTFEDIELSYGDGQQRRLGSSRREATILISPIERFALRAFAATELELKLADQARLRGVVNQQGRLLFQGRSES